jgi:hypothetical protein
MVRYCIFPITVDRFLSGQVELEHMRERGRPHGWGSPPWTFGTFGVWVWYLGPKGTFPSLYGRRGHHW